MKFTLSQLLLFAFFCAIICALFSFIAPARRAALESACDGHLSQINGALWNYKYDHQGKLPPLYVTDVNGKPNHSWRVLILPYLGYESLYKSYNFNEPWDGPNNQKLVDHMPAIFGCPNSDAKGFTPYLAVSTPGNKELFDQSSPTSIIVVELNTKMVNWMSPTDISAEEFAELSSKKSFANLTAHDGHLGIIRNDGRKQRIAVPD